MNRFPKFSVTMILLGMSVAAVAQTTAPATPSLGDLARNARKDKTKSSARVYDNDNLPQTDKLSVVGTPSNDPAAANTPRPDAEGDVPPTAKVDESDKKEIKKVEPGQSVDERAKINDEWKKKVETKKSQVDALNRDLDLVQREFRLRQASYYSNAGLRLNNPAAWDRDDLKYKQDIDDKQAAVEKAKGELEELQEQARKAGIPSSARE